MKCIRLLRRRKREAISSGQPLSKNPVTLLFERVDTGDIHSGDQQVYIMCTFVGDHRLKVHHVAHDAKLPGDTHTAKYLS